MKAELIHCSISIARLWVCSHQFFLVSIPTWMFSDTLLLPMSFCWHWSLSHILLLCILSYHPSLFLLIRPIFLASSIFIKVAVTFCNFFSVPLFLLSSVEFNLTLPPKFYFPVFSWLSFIVLFVYLFLTFTESHLAFRSQVRVDGLVSKTQDFATGYWSSRPVWNNCCCCHMTFVMLSWESFFRQMFNKMILILKWMKMKERWSRVSESGSRVSESGSAEDY